MGNDIAGFFRSLTAASLLRIALTAALTTGSVLMAYRDKASPVLLIGCNIVTMAGAFYMEYRNYRARL
jgi:hypothetical protein